MEKKKITIVTIVVFVVGLIITGASYAFWSWTSNVNKNVVFNVASNLKNYIVYNEGESAFTGELNVSNNYQTNSIHSTISIYKTTNVNLLATIHMDVNQIGPNMKQSTALKWVVTEGTTSNVGSVLAKGNFIGTNNGDTLTLVPDLVVSTTETFYTIWIWLDASQNPSSNLTGETLDTNVWVEVNQVEGAEDRYEITNTNAHYQQISATVVDSKAKVTQYAVTETNSTPSSWTTITPATDQAKVYTLNTNVSAIGTYYVWFMDENNKIIGPKEVSVTTIDNTAPSCSWSNFTPTIIRDTETATVTLTCTDSESSVSVYNLSTTDFNVLSNGSASNIVSVTNVTKESTTNGYIYTITVTGSTTDGVAYLTLPANKIKNGVAIGNTSTSSGNITVENIISISNATVTLEYTSTTYNGSAKTPTVTVSVNGTPLTLNTDYTLAYSNNTNVGTATVTITGINRYSGTVTRNFTISYNAFNITLNNANATTNGTSTIYMRYADGVYLNSNYTNKMTTSTNAITIPQRTGYDFMGYYDNDTQMIDSDGHITSAFTNTIYSSAKTLSAHWTAIDYSVSFNENLFNGTNTSASGLTFAYDRTNQYITINGSFNSTIATIGKLFDKSVTVGDIYEITVKYISGSFTSSTIPRFYFSFQKDDANFPNVTNGIHRQSVALPTSNSNGDTITVTTTIADANTLYYWLYESTANTTEFNDYEIQVLITKVYAKVVTYDTVYGTLPTPEKPGYVFDGWYTELSGGTRIYDTTMLSIPDSHVLYAHWSLDTYTLNINSMCGSIPTTSGWTNDSDNITASKTVTFNDPYGTFPTPVKTGHDFVDWQNIHEYGNKTVSAGTATNKNFRIYDNAKPGVTYKVKFASATLTEGTATQFSVRIYDYTTTTSLALKEVSFGSDLSVDITCPLTADRTHDISVIVYAGVVGSTAGNTVEFTGITVNSTANQTVQSYGTNTAKKANTPRDHDLVAIWQAITYEVQYNKNTTDAVSNMPSASTTYIYATTGNVNLSSTVPTRVGYNFLGWSTSSTTTTASYAAGADWAKSNVPNSGTTFTLYAVWQIKSITCAAGKYLRASDATCQNCTAGNYCPGGTWTYDASSNKGISQCVAGKYSGNGASSCTNCVAGSYSAAGAAGCTVCANGTTNSAGSSSCGTTCSNATGVSTWVTPTWNSSNNSVSNSCTVNSCNYGYFKSGNNCTNTVVISFNANGGGGAPGNMTYTYDPSGNTYGYLPTKIPAWSGRQFMGWSESSSGSNPVYQRGVVWYYSNISRTLYAKWNNNNTCTVAYELNGGTNMPEPTIYTWDKSGSTYTNLTSTVPRKSGKTFKGWSDSATATSPSYSSGQVWYCSNGSRTLYAVWG